MKNATTRILRARLLVAMGLGAVGPILLTACGSSSDDDTGPAPGHAGKGAGAGAAGDAGTGGPGAGVGGASGRGGTSGGHAGASSGSGGRAGSGAVAGSGGAAGMPGGGGTAGGGVGGNDRFCQPWPQCATVRRPFLVGSDMRSAEPRAREDWTRAMPPVAIAHARTTEFLAESWLKDALEEHASIAAFARFSMLLLSVGAPPELVIASQRASLDEVAHARACFALARRYGARNAGPSTLEVADSLTPLSLAELAALTVTEGAVGETLGALLASEQRARASDPEVCRVLERLARDEARHAELAWKFVAWAVESGGADVRSAIRNAFEAASAHVLAMPVVDYGVDEAVWHAHGRVTCAEARAIARQGLDEVVWPCLRALLAAASSEAGVLVGTPAFGDTDARGGTDSRLGSS